MQRNKFKKKKKWKIDWFYIAISNAVVVITPYWFWIIIKLINHVLLFFFFTVPHITSRPKTRFKTNYEIISRSVGPEKK